MTTVILTNGNSYIMDLEFTPNPKYIEIYGKTHEKELFARYNELKQMEFSEFVKNIKEFNRIELELKVIFQNN